MLRKFLAGLFFLSSLVASAQFTAVNTTGVVDSDATTWANGTWKIEFAPNPNTPGLGQYYVNGTTKLTDPSFSAYLVQSGSLSALGAFSTNVIDNSKITPSGSQWKFTVCPMATSKCGIVTSVMAGTSVNITSLLNNTITAPRFVATFGSYGYNSTEASLQVVPGSTYYDVTLKCQSYYDPIGLTWGCPSGGGSPPGGPVTAIQANLDNTHFTGGKATVNVTTGATNSSVNTVLNVQMFGAKGDCSTDDEPAVALAQTTALTFSTGNQSTAALYFPKGSGGCYLFGNPLPWLGVPLIGQAAGLSNLNAGGVTIKGSPGKDVIHVADPNVSAISFHNDWAIRDITLLVDDTISTVGLFPHRWPGRWFDSAAMTNGSAILTDAAGKSRIGCGDIGQAIKVTGAGTAGADLVTTISSVTPCWAGAVVQSSALTITLGAAASTTVTNAHTYISVSGYSATYTMGNAAIAFDNYDANKANWVNPAQQTAQSYNHITNVTIGTTNNGQANASVGIFVQGDWSWYGTFVDNVNIYRITWPMAQVCNELSSATGTCMNDMQRWTHMKVNGDNGFLTYDGMLTHYTDIQFDVQRGPQYLSLTVAGEYGPHFMYQENVELEGTNVTTIGTRYTGQDGYFNGVALDGAGNTSYFDSADTYCKCGWLATLNVGGYGNKFESIGDETGATTVNAGKSNSFVSRYLANPLLSNPPSMAYSITKASLLGRTAGLWSADFVQDGNFSTPYNRFDFMILPGDWIYNFGSVGVLTGFDAASPTGEYIDIPSLFNSGTFNQFTYTGAKNSFIAPGVNFPTTGVTVYFNARCLTPGNITLELHGFVGGVDTAVLGTTGLVACTTNYQDYKIRATSSLIGYTALNIKNPLAKTVRMSWMYFSPDLGTLNNKNLGTGGVQYISGPGFSTAGHIATFADSIGTIQDGGVAPTGLANIQISIGSFAIPANTCYGSTGSTTPATAAMSGLTTTSTPYASFAVNSSGITGWGSAGGLSLQLWPTLNTLNYLVCNSTSGSITGGAITFNVGAR